MTSSPLAFVFGTRPEVIKLGPLITDLAQARIPMLLIHSGQHEELSQQALDLFSIAPTHKALVMEHGQLPHTFLSRLLPRLNQIFRVEKPLGIIVQGDTATALGGALAASESKIPLAHVEAGLRSFDLNNPYPEEIFRRVITHNADLHFCPTQSASDNLHALGITRNVYCVGNTVLDAVRLITSNASYHPNEVAQRLRSSYNKLLFVTCHRRENFNHPLKTLCAALRQLCANHRSLGIAFAMHLNPSIRAPVLQMLAQQERIHLLEPLDYRSTLFMLEKADCVLTDSGGIQEEIQCFDTPLLVTRRTTERPEAVAPGCGKLVPLAETAEVVSAISVILDYGEGQPRRGNNPFGDGHSAEKISKILHERWLS